MKTDLGKTGFTLLELAITLGIIMILASLTFPVIARVREHSRRVDCTNNIRQWGFAVIAYIDDNKGKYPVGNITNEELVWSNVLPPYLTGSNVSPMNKLMNDGKVPCPGVGRSIYICPSQPGNQELIDKYKAAQHDTFFSSYAYNSEFENNIRLSKIQNAAKTVLFAESHNGTSPTITQNVFEFKDNEDKIFRHRKTTNICFADGHVENLSADLTKGNTSLITWAPYKEEEP